jgi:vacuolar-type H+-ATPase subunit F/Vma7
MSATANKRVKAETRAIVFIGDELTAAGFRLTGIETVVPSREATRDALAHARSRAELVLLTAECARHVPAAELQEALSAEMPILTIIPDILALSSPPDLTGTLRATLGIES